MQKHTKLYLHKVSLEQQISSSTVTETYTVHILLCIPYRLETDETSQSVFSLRDRTHKRVELGMSFTNDTYRQPGKNNNVDMQTSLPRKANIKPQKARQCELLINSTSTVSVTGSQSVVQLDQRQTYLSSSTPA